VLPGPTIPDGFGVNIHFTDAEPGELEALAASGNRFVRMDLAWQGVEREKGEYDFARYDRLVADMSRLKIRILFILDYAHRLYDDGLPPRTAEGRLAFARFAAAAAKRYAGKGILWEIWNEPNIKQFWKPQPNAADYCKLALVTIDAMREADPRAFIVGPASSTFPWEFFEVMGEQGVFKKLDAVSVHPYRQANPETAEQDYARLRLLLHKYLPEKRLPILSGEWDFRRRGAG
jgi:polysaccharide biosynthesis protein PslG